MGLHVGFSGCGCSEKCGYASLNNSSNRGSNNPNPRNFNITAMYSFAKHTVIKVNYPNCTNYEGNKILVYDKPYTEIEKAKVLDPHFCDGEHLSPIARFEPTTRGFLLAINLAKSLEYEVGR